VSAKILTIPTRWLEHTEECPEGWLETHAPGLLRVWPSARESTNRVCRTFGCSYKLFVQRMEREQSACSYAWDGSTRDYRQLGDLNGHFAALMIDQGVDTDVLVDAGDRWKLFYLCGVDKTNSGPRPDGWFGPLLQLAGVAARFCCVYQGKPLPEADWLPELPQALRGYRMDRKAYAAGIPYSGPSWGGKVLTPANDATAWGFAYMTSPGQEQLRTIAERFGWGADYEADAAGSSPLSDGGVPGPNPGEQETTMSKLIVLDAGHPPGGGAPGHGCPNEDVLNGLIRDALGPMLEAAGHRVHLCQRTNSVTRIGQESAALAPDVFLSIHHNSASDSSARGFECYTAGPAYSGGIPGAKCCPKATLLAGLLAKSVMSEFSLPAHGKAVRDDWNNGGRLGVLNGGYNWSGPGAAVLVEMAFVSSTRDAAILAASDYPRRAAGALFRGIQSYLGGSQDIPETTEEPEAHSGVAEEWSERVRADQTWLKSHGFDPGDVDGIMGPRTIAAMNACQQGG
jgi:N-acetylmuramoyl-L-alanine amidase